MSICSTSIRFSLRALLVVQQPQLVMLSVSSWNKVCCLHCKHTIEYIKKQKAPIDWIRNARFTGVNLLVISPLYHYYTALLLPKILPVTTKASLVRKLIVDQTAGASFFISAFFFGMSLFEGKGVQEGLDNVKGKYWYSLKYNWLLWPAANAINFGIIPLKFQVLYFNFVSMFWNIFLSYAQNVYKPEAGKLPHQSKAQQAFLLTEIL
eukprot:TRINITY_DN164_c1_g1_i1.p3 TRINITY_DN164_c1_g1~~TRINITY_DN164_c1_g1_i1.p3  ORF type:complete len:208 (-),score=17.65 TRINITY_DN164_c1_g1_i1:1026-1649(-)